jgi:hypothetical protein
MRFVQVPVAILNIVNKEQVHSLSKIGIENTTTPRHLSFCSYAILDHKPDVTIIPDARSISSTFRHHSFVTGAFHLRFYAGAAVTCQGVKVGALCLVDTESRLDFDEKREQVLSDMGKIVSDLFNERRSWTIREKDCAGSLATSTLQGLKLPLSEVNACQEVMKLLMLMLKKTDEHGKII